MYLRNVSVQSLRNLKSATIEWSSGFNYLYGPNGAGKTAILEAVHALSLGRSFRTRKTKSLISHGADNFVVRGVVSAHAPLEVEGDDPPAVELQMGIMRSASGQTQLRLNGETKHKISDLARHLPVQVMLPDTSEIIFGAPKGRRGFVDWGLFHVEHDFLSTATAYNRALAQRNAWLKTTDATGGQAFDPWAESLLESGLRVLNMRKRFLSQWLPRLGVLLQEFDLPGEISIELNQGGYEENLDSAEKKMSENWSRDVKFGQTHSGPHRADLAIFVDGQPAAEVLSRGQAKLVSCALILAQIETLREDHQQPTVVLIDDYGAELDQDHWVRFSQTLKGLGCQVIATSNGLPARAIEEWADPESFRLFHVEQGGVRVVERTD